MFVEPYDMQSDWPDEVECYVPECEEACHQIEDQGSGLVGYRCPVHGDWLCQYDDDADDLYLEIDDDYDPYDDDFEYEEDSD